MNILIKKICISILKKQPLFLLVVAFLLSVTSTAMNTKDCENGEISTGGRLGGNSNFGKKESI